MIICVIFFEVKNNMNLMKFVRRIIGAFGFSTFHLHNVSLFNTSSLSNVIPPEVRSGDLLTEVEKQLKGKNFSFQIIEYKKNDDDIPVCIKTKNNRGSGYRPPKHIKPTRNHGRPQSGSRKR